MQNPWGFGPTEILILEVFIVQPTPNTHPYGGFALQLMHISLTNIDVKSSTTKILREEFSQLFVPHLLLNVL